MIRIPEFKSSTGNELSPKSRYGTASPEASISPINTLIVTGTSGARRPIFPVDALKCVFAQRIPPIPVEFIISTRDTLAWAL